MIGKGVSSRKEDEEKMADGIAVATAWRRRCKATAFMISIACGIPLESTVMSS